MSLVAATIMLGGNDPVMRQQCEVPVIYGVLPDAIQEGASLYIGNDKVEVTKVDHILSDDGTMYERLLVHAERNSVKKVKARHRPRVKLTVPKR